MEALASAGIRVGIGIAPVIPGLSSDIPVLLKRAKEAGAESAFINMLRLPGNVAPYFEERLREKLPTKADRVLNSGKGQYWEATERLFKIHCQRLGFNKKRAHQTPAGTTFRRPTAQASLF
jgi:DNA repair photolyase